MPVVGRDIKTTSVSVPFRSRLEHFSHTGDRFL